MEETAGDLTDLLRRMEAGEEEAASEVISRVYRELRRIAGHQMKAERASHTLAPTALVNEAYLRLVDQTRVNWQGRAHFFRVAATLMRRVLVDHARQRNAGKREGGLMEVDLQGVDLEISVEKPEELLAVDEALDHLKEFDSRQADIAELRYFSGLTIEETAKALDISPRTVKREWTMARAWLQAELSERRQP